MYKPVHILSRKSIQQQGNVFIWCTGSRSLVGCFEFLISKSSNTFPGWRRVDNNHSPITVPTAYRWITDAVLDQSTAHNWLEAERFTLFPVEVRPSMVLTYSVYKNGSGLSRESQDIIPPDFPVELFLRGGALTKQPFSFAIAIFVSINHSPFTRTCLWTFWHLRKRNVNTRRRWCGCTGVVFVHISSSLILVAGYACHGHVHTPCSKWIERFGHVELFHLLFPLPFP